MYMDINKLKTASELKSKLGKFLTTPQLIDLANRKIVPHYILTNPFSGEESVWFISSEVDAWIRRYIREVNVIPQTELIFINYNTNECKIESHDIVPDELSMIKNLCKLPKVKINTPPGIYFLCNNKKIVYIGKAINVGDRIAEHVRERMKKFDSVYFVCCHIDQLTSIETACIKFFKPQYNVAAINGSVKEKEKKIITDFLQVSVITP